MKALIVVDMLNDFVDEKGALSFEAARTIVPFIKSRVNEYRKNSDYIMFLRDWHKENDLEFRRFPAHAIKWTWGAEIIPELNSELHSIKGKGKEAIINKQRYSGFFGTKLHESLQILKKVHDGIESVEVVGVCTSICVMDTVGGLANRDYNIIVPKAGVADFDPDNHAFALKRMENLYGAKVI